MKNKNINFSFLVIQIVIFLTIKSLSTVNYDKQLIGKNSISYCNEFGIKYFFKNIIFNHQTSITLIELNFLSSNQINFEQLKCLGRVIVFSNMQTPKIFIGFDSIFNNYTILFCEILVVLIFYKKLKLVYINILLIELIYIYFFPASFNHTYIIIFNFYLLLYLNKSGLNKVFSNNYTIKNQKQISFTFLFLIFALIVYKIINFEYMIGYWLANYKYGFIRRGLLGHIFLLISNFTNLKLILIINCFFILCYIILFYYIFKYFNLKKRSFYSYLILFSPAFLTYNIFDNFVIARPEILGILSFLFYLDKKVKNIKVILTTLLFITISILSHSINLFVIPILITEILFKNKFKNINFIEVCEVIIYSLVGFLFVLIFKNNTNDINYIINNLCKDALSLNIRNDICSGAIGWLNESLGGQLKMIGFWTDKQQIYYLGYVITISLSLIPFYKAFTKISKIETSIIFISLIPFFYIQYDWGRVINIFITYISFKYFQNNKRIKYSNLEISNFLILVYSSIWFVPVARGYRIDNISLNYEIRLLTGLIIICLLYFFRNKQKNYFETLNLPK